MRGRRGSMASTATGEKSETLSEKLMGSTPNMTPENTALRRVVRWVALLNLGYFGVEFAVATAIGSVSLFADSIDFLEDASINLLILTALGWSAARRARLGMALAGVL